LSNPWKQAVTVIAMDTVMVMVMGTMVEEIEAVVAIMLIIKILSPNNFIFF
jgi:hypothetical protein